MISDKQEIMRELLPKTFSNSKIINLVTEVCKRYNIGNRNEKQKMFYSNKEKEIVKKIYSLLLWINENECENFRTREESIILIENLINAISNKKSILIFALFCPSYKKGKEVIGSNTQIGKTTKGGVINLFKITKKVRSLGINCTAQVIFSDLALENYNKLLKKDFEDLQKDYEDFVKFVKGIDNSIEFVRLSKIGNCKKRIGLSGITSGEVPLGKKKIQRIVKRSLPFYGKILGWSKQKIRKRTEDLARSCSVMAEEILAQNKLAINVMTENIYERGVFYTVGNNKPVPTFYPLKYNNMRIVIIGGPLSGKSTVASKLALELGIPHIAAGRILISHLNKMVENNQKTNSPSFKDDTLLRLIEEKIRQSGKKGFVLEQFPKYREEFTLFDKKWKRIDLLVVIEFDEKLSMERMKDRLICPNCYSSFNQISNPLKIIGECNICKSILMRREDDNEETIRARIKEYKNIEKDCLDFLKNKAKKIVFLKANFNIDTIDFSSVMERDYQNFTTP